MVDTTMPAASPQSCEWFTAGFHPWWLLLLWGLLSLAIGIMFLASPGITTVIFITFLGAYWLVSGIFSLASLAVDRTDMGWKILLAILNLIAGIIILAYPLYSTVLLLTFLVILVGVWACITGGTHLYVAFSKKDAGNGVLGIISLLFGILLLIFPLISAALVPFIAGIFAIVIGFAAIVAAYSAKKTGVAAPAA